MNKPNQSFMKRCLKNISFLIFTSLCYYSYGQVTTSEARVEDIGNVTSIDDQLLVNYNSDVISKFKSNISGNTRIEVYNSVGNINLGIAAHGATAGFGYIWPSTHKFMIGNDGGPAFVIIGNDGNAKVGIGTTSPTHKLHVAGQIRAQSAYWADFVFEKEYALPSLEEVDQFIQTHGHLKDVPSEREVMENGVNLTEMDAILLQKIEELTLYQLQLLEMLKAQQKEIEALRDEE